MYPLDRSILTSLTPGRIVNAGRVFSSYFLSSLTGRARLWGNPVFLSIEPTSLCNLRCPECPSGAGELNRSGGFMSYESFKNIIDPVKNSTLGLLLYFQGEPFLNRDIHSMIAYARRTGMYVIVSTNAHYFTQEHQARQLIDSGLNSLIVSIDGITQETYERYRVGGSLEKVLHGVENIMKARKTARKRLPRIYFQFVVMSHNEHEIAGAKELAKKYGADKIFFKNVQIVHDENSALLPNSKKYRPYDLHDNGLQMKGAVPDKCLRLWTGSVVTWDGRHVPCCFDKTGAHAYGTVDKIQTIPELLQSESAGAFRQKIITSRSSIPLCAGCREGRTGIWHTVKKALNL